MIGEHIIYCSKEYQHEESNLTIKNSKLNEKVEKLRKLLEEKEDYSNRLEVGDGEENINLNEEINNLRKEKVEKDRYILRLEINTRDFEGEVVEQEEDWNKKIQEYLANINSLNKELIQIREINEKLTLEITEKEADYENIFFLGFKA